MRNNRLRAYYRHFRSLDADVGRSRVSVNNNKAVVVLKGVLGLETALLGNAAQEYLRFAEQCERT